MKHKRTIEPVLIIKEDGKETKIDLVPIELTWPTYEEVDDLKRKAKLSEEMLNVMVEGASKCIKENITEENLEKTIKYHLIFHDSKLRKENWAKDMVLTDMPTTYTGIEPPEDYTVIWEPTCLD